MSEDDAEQNQFEQPELELEGEWVEDTEKFVKMSEADLWHYLGFGDQKIPFFNELIVTPLAKKPCRVRKVPHSLPRWPMASTHWHLQNDAKCL